MYRKVAATFALMVLVSTPIFAAERAPSIEHSGAQLIELLDRTLQGLTDLALGIVTKAEHRPAKAGSNPTPPATPGNAGPDLPSPSTQAEPQIDPWG